MRRYTGSQIGEELAQILVAEVLVGLMQARIAHGRNKRREQVGQLVAPHVGVGREHTELLKLPGLLDVLAGFDDTVAGAAIAAGAQAASFECRQRHRLPLALQIRRVVLEEAGVPVGADLRYELTGLDRGPPRVTLGRLRGDLVFIAQIQNPIHGLDRELGVECHLTIFVEVVCAALAKQHIVSWEGSRLHLALADQFSAGQVILPGVEADWVGAGSFPDIAAIVQHHRRQRMLDPVLSSLTIAYPPS